MVRHINILEGAIDIIVRECLIDGFVGRVACEDSLDTSTALVSRQGRLEVDNTTGEVGGGCAQFHPVAVPYQLQHHWVPAAAA